MEIIDSLVGRFWKREKPAPISEVLGGRSTQKVWTYGYFIDYLTALTRGRNFLLSLDQYPDLIQLSQANHETLEDLRRRTALHGREYYNIIGFSEIMGSIGSLGKPSRGERGRVPADVLQSTYAYASTIGVDKVIGDIHTHPHASHLAFSLGDLYRMVYKGSVDFVHAIVGRDENLFVFKTRESTTIGLAQEVLSQENFCRYWYENNGYKFNGISKNGEDATISANDMSIWGLNLKVAKRHNLVLYSGDATVDLVKVFPTVKSRT